MLDLDQASEQWSRHNVGIGEAIRLSVAGDGGTQALGGEMALAMGDDIRPACSAVLGLPEARGGRVCAVFPRYGEEDGAHPHPHYRPISRLNRLKLMVAI